VSGHQVRRSVEAFWKRWEQPSASEARSPARLRRFAPRPRRRVGSEPPLIPAGEFDVPKLRPLGGERRARAASAPHSSRS